MQSNKDWLNLMIFRQAQKLFAVPVEPIQQSIEKAAVSPIFPVGDYMEGVINYNEVLVPVINLCACLSLPRGTPRLHTPILLLTIQDRMAGLLVDEFEEVISIPSSGVIPLEGSFTQSNQEPTILRGWVKVQHGMAILLNLDHLLIPDQAILVNALLIGSDSASQPGEK